MDWSAIWEFCQAAQFHVIAGLIVLDIVLGVSNALRTGEFDWCKLFQFHLSMTTPYFLTYAVLYIVVGFIPALEGFVGDGIVGLSFLAVTGRLVLSITGHLRAMEIMNPRSQ